MNQKQLSLFIRHAFSLTNAEAAAIKGANPAFARAMVQIRELVEGLPEADLLKASTWKSLKPQVMAALKPYNNAFRNSLYSTLDEIDPDIREYAQKSLDAVTAPAPVGTTGPIRNAPGGGLQSIGSSQLADSTVQAIRRTSVANVKLDRLFRVGGGETDVSLWMQQNYKAIDRIVGTGIIQGASTDAIAAQISEEASLKGLLKATKGTAAGNIKAQAKTVARTAVQSFNHQVKEQVWDANADALEGLVYEWSAATDSRVCPTCGPLDGQKKPKRSDLPSTPIHPNCRCGVVVVDPDDDDDVRTGIAISKENKPTGDNAYKTKVSINKQNFYRQAVTLKKPGATYADYLAEIAKDFPATSGKVPNLPSKMTLREEQAVETLSTFFGGAGKAGQGQSSLGTQRANWFASTVKKGVSPDKALKHLVTRPDPETKLRAFKTKWGDIDPPAPKAPKPKPKPPAPKPKPKTKAKPKVVAPKQAKALADKAISDVDKLLAKSEAKLAKAKKALEVKLAKAQKLQEKSQQVLSGKAAPLTEAEKAAKPPRAALKSYTGENFESIRAQQIRAAKQAGRKLSPYAEDMVEDFRSSKLHTKQAAEIEAYLKRAPKYKGEVRRGMNVPQSAVDEMIAQYSKGEGTLAMESWTFSDVMQEFTVGMDQQVVLKAANKRGVDVSRLSAHPLEDEVLMPAGARYKLKGVEKEEISPGLSKKGVYRWIIDLEQL